MFAGVIADVGIPQAQVVNLSRSGAEARDWNSWLTPGEPAVQPTLSDLVSGSAADLVCIGVGGNDYWAGRTAAQYTTSLTSLITRVRAMLPSASICLNTQPPGNPGVTPNWDTIQNATVAVATSQNCALIEWRENFPIPNNGAGLYAPTVSTSPTPDPCCAAISAHPSSFRGTDNTPCHLENGGVGRAEGTGLRIARSGGSQSDLRQLTFCLCRHTDDVALYPLCAGMEGYVGSSTFLSQIRVRK